jgi:hypothetical protein
MVLKDTIAKLRAKQSAVKGGYQVARKRKGRTNKPAVTVPPVSTDSGNASPGV